MRSRWKFDYVENTNRKCIHIGLNGDFSADNMKTLSMEAGWTFQDFLKAASRRLNDLVPIATRAFNVDGVEIDDCMMIEDNDMLFLSNNGDDFVMPDIGHQADGVLYNELAEGTKVLGYTVSSFLGRGGFGEVRLGEHQLTNEKVALKFLRKSEILTINAAERTVTEIQCLAKLKHANIIKLIHHTETPQHVVLIFELMEGGDLLKYLCKRGETSKMIALSEDECRPLFHQIVSGISFAHNNHICHRDLKLENILLKGPNLSLVKIADFGLSDFYRPGSTMKSNCGTLSFLSPEVFHGTSNAGPPLDAWALGVILFAITCGRLPFEDGSLSNRKRPKEVVVKQRILKGSYKLDETLSPEVKDLVRRLLKINPDERATIPDVLNHCWIKLNYSGGFSPDSSVKFGYLSARMRLSSGDKNQVTVDSLNSSPNSSSINLANGLNINGPKSGNASSSSFKNGFSVPSKILNTIKDVTDSLNNLLISGNLSSPNSSKPKQSSTIKLHSLSSSSLNYKSNDAGPLNTMGSTGVNVLNGQRSQVSSRRNSSDFHSDVNTDSGMNNMFSSSPSSIPHINSASSDGVTSTERSSLNGISRQNISTNSLDYYNSHSAKDVMKDSVSGSHSVDTASPISFAMSNHDVSGAVIANSPLLVGSSDDQNRGALDTLDMHVIDETFSNSHHNRVNSHTSISGTSPSSRFSMSPSNIDIIHVNPTRSKSPLAVTLDSSSSNSNIGTTVNTSTNMNKLIPLSRSRDKSNPSKTNVKSTIDDYQTTGMENGNNGNTFSQLKRLDSDNFSSNNNVSNNNIGYSTTAKSLSNSSIGTHSSSSNPVLRKNTSLERLPLHRESNVGSLEEDDISVGLHQQGQKSYGKNNNNLSNYGNSLPKEDTPAKRSISPVNRTYVNNGSIQVQQSSLENTSASNTDSDSSDNRLSSENVAKKLVIVLEKSSGNANNSSAYSYSNSNSNQNVNKNLHGLSFMNNRSNYSIDGLSGVTNITDDYTDDYYDEDELTTNQPMLQSEIKRNRNKREGSASSFTSSFSSFSTISSFNSSTSSVPSSNSSTRSMQSNNSSNLKLNKSRVSNSTQFGESSVAGQTAFGGSSFRGTVSRYR